MFWLISLCFSAFAANIASTQLSEIEAGVKAFLNVSGSSQSVVAFDYDDTLLSPVSVLGSEGWFNWQEELLNGESRSDRRAADFDGLLTLQNRMLGLVRFQPTDVGIPQFISDLQALGAAVIVCTSRGPAEMTSTIRELKLNGIDLSKSQFAKQHEAFKPYLPYDLKRPADAGFTKSEIKKLGLGLPRTVTFVSGVYFTEGQNKGAMLRSLIHRKSTTPGRAITPVRALVFIDNRKKHTDRVDAAFQGKNIKLYTAHFNAVDIDSKPFSAFPDKIERSRVEWERLRGFIE